MVRKRPRDGNKHYCGGGGESTTTTLTTTRGYLQPQTMKRGRVRDNLGLAPTSRPKDHYIWLLTSQTSLGTLYSSALLGRTLTGWCNEMGRWKINSINASLESCRQCRNRVKGNKKIIEIGLQLKQCLKGFCMLCRAHIAVPSSKGTLAPNRNTIPLPVICHHPRVQSTE